MGLYKIDLDFRFYRRTTLQTRMNNYDQIPQAVTKVYEDAKALRGVCELKRGIGKFTADWSTVVWSDGLRLSTYAETLSEEERKKFWDKAYALFQKSVKETNQRFQKEAAAQEQEDIKDLIEVFTQMLEEGSSDEEILKEAKNGFTGDNWTISSKIARRAAKQAIQLKPTPIQPLVEELTEN